MYLEKLQMDVAYLQETHLLPPEIDKLNSMGWKVLAAAPFNSKARGVVILVKASLNFTLHSSIVDLQGCYVRADATISLSRLVICNIYTPNSYSKDLFLHLINKLHSFGNKLLLLAGDFNIVSSARMGKFSLTSRLLRFPKIGSPYIAKQLHLIGVWRASNPLERDFPCILAAHETMSRIDYVLPSEFMFSRILESHIEHVCVSDHAVCWIYVALKVDKGHTDNGNSLLIWCTL